MFQSEFHIAPLALRAAKQAISRSEDLPLETGKSFCTKMTAHSHLH